MNPVEKDRAIWNTPIPMCCSPVSQTEDGSVSYGDYFHSVRAFLEGDGFHHLTVAASAQMGRDIGPEEIESVDIYQEKHGEFYHPARISAAVRGTSVELVLNCALSEAGRDIICREYNLLNRLNPKQSPSFLPRVYSIGEGCASLNTPKIPMFLGEWLEGYHEFHLSENPDADENPLVVWDPERGNIILAAEAVREIYRQTAFIMTCYYDFETFDQIYPWHHAAGDFVVAMHDRRVALKLITVRNYTAFTEQGTAGLGPGGQTESALVALLVFLINLSIRTRLDRLDGIGAIVWSGDIAVAATVEGFFQSLARKNSFPGVPGALAQVFFDYLCSYSESALFALASAIVDGCNPKAPEIPVMKRHLKRHVATLYNYITH